MKIGFISQEFPPDTGGGGIGTYLAQTTELLAAGGHAVEVFSGAAGREGRTVLASGVVVHRVSATSADSFRAAILPVFAAAHRSAPFDVIEANDFDAPANAIKLAFPHLPCVVKLHTPRFVIDEMHQRPLTRWQRWRMRLGAWRRGQASSLPSCSVSEQPSAQAELAALELADEIAAPSQAVANAATAWTQQARSKLTVFPYSYQPSPALLGIPPGGQTQRVTYLGRLEERKGVVDLADAIPAVLRRHPTARFRFVGRPMESPRRDQDMRAFLGARLSRVSRAVEFTGPLPPSEIPRIMAETDLLVAPSHWESFGLVCCEGMAAARAVIGSTAGGMPEILDGGRCGLLAPPRAPAVLAGLIGQLLSDGVHRRQLGEAARRRVLEHFAPARVLALQLASYERAISRCRSHYPVAS